MINYTYTITNKLGDTITLNDHTNPNSVFALQTYPKFTKNIKNSEIERNGQNGYWDFYSFNGKLSIAFTGVIIGETPEEVEEKKMLMLKVFAIPFQSTAENDGYVTIRWTDESGIDKEVEAKIIQDISFDRPIRRRDVIDFQIQLKTRKNYILSQLGYTGETHQKRGYYSQGGIYLPLTLPFSWNPSYQNILTITIPESGAFPKIILRGEDQQVITNPTVKSITTGETLKINTVLNNSSDYIEINTEDGTITNQAGLDLSGSLSIESSFINLVSGTNELVYLSDEDPITTGIIPEAGNKISVSYRIIYAS